MITHENLVQAIYEDSHEWSCDGYLACKVDIDCISCCENKLIEYENALRAEALAEALKPYDVEDIEDLIRNVKNKTIAPLEREIAILNRVELTERNLACFVFRIREIIEQMKEGAENGRS